MSTPEILSPLRPTADVQSISSFLRSSIALLQSHISKPLHKFRSIFIFTNPHCTTTMAINNLLHLLTFAFLLTLAAASSSNPPEFSPSPSDPSDPPSPPPQSGSDDSISLPSSSPDSPPPVPPPSNRSPDDPDRSPSPSPSEAGDATAETESEDRNESPASGGMSGGKKVGIAFGLTAAACFVGFGGVLYRKRRENIRRARYSQAARLEFF
ncbi:hypothetical protein SSX86_023431 [Deinandra increscens subsp. villosa]|uniref:Uncharacterized protein n=2 Tax=Deinandra increscens subsp. villosa TaxID=3103831 RepID=A0AAP0GSB5_9ASTR